MKHTQSDSGGRDVDGAESLSAFGLDSVIKPPRLRALDLHDLLALDIAPREMVLDPIVPEKGLMMIYGLRGTGKRQHGGQGNESRLTKPRPASWNGFSWLNPHADGLGLRVVSFRNQHFRTFSCGKSGPYAVKFASVSRPDVRR